MGLSVTEQFVKSNSVGELQNPPEETGAEDASETLPEAALFRTPRAIRQDVFQYAQQQAVSQWAHQEYHRQWNQFSQPRQNAVYNLLGIESHAQQQLVYGHLLPEGERSRLFTDQNSARYERYAAESDLKFGFTLTVFDLMANAPSALQGAGPSA